MTNNPVTQNLFGGVTLLDAINPTHASIVSPTTSVLSGHNILFSQYVQSDTCEPKATKDDLKTDVTYRAWLSRNLTALTKNYVAHLLDGYLNNTFVVQAVNDTITNFVTTTQNDAFNTQTQQHNYEQHLTTHTQTAAVQLRRCQPHRFRSGRNK